MLGLKLIHVIKSGPRFRPRICLNLLAQNCYYASRLHQKHIVPHRIATRGLSETSHMKWPYPVQSYTSKEPRLGDQLRSRTKHLSQNCHYAFTWKAYFEDFVQDCSISIANALEILQSCTKPLICSSSNCHKGIIWDQPYEMAISSAIIYI